MRLFQFQLSRVRFQALLSQYGPMFLQLSSHGDVVTTFQLTGAGGGLEVQVPGEVPHQDGGAWGTGGG